MFEYLFLTILFAIALMGALALTFGTVGGLQWARRFPDGVLSYYFYAVFFSGGLSILVSTRNFELTGELFEQTLTSNPIAAWAIRVTSVVAVFGAVDQFFRYFKNGGLIFSRRFGLVFGLLAIWSTGLIVPAFLASNPVGLQLSWFYSLFLGAGLILLSNAGAESCVIACRNAIVVFCALSLLMIPLRPDLVLQTNYTQGYLPGVPRFAGLTPHAGVMGLNACLALWCLFAYPIERRWLHWLAVVIAATSMFLAQTKATWIAFFIVWPVMIVCQKGFPSFNNIATSKRRSHALLMILGGVGVLVFGGIAFLVGGGVDQLDRFFSSEQGAQLLSVTGRDRIWTVALDEWSRSPIFGYGLPLFDAEHRMKIGMWYATSGHNQFIDALGRTGFIGVVATISYMGALLWLGLRFGVATRGLSAVLALSLWIRTISDVPISFTTIGIDTIPYYLLLAVLASQLTNTGRRSKVAANG